MTHKKEKYSELAYWEIFYPLFFAFIISISYFFVSDHLSLDFTGLINSSLNLFGILIGFLITVLTIINTIENSYTRALKKGGSFHLLSTYLKHAIWGCFLSVVMGISYIFLKFSISTYFKLIGDTIFLFSFLFALLSSYRFIRIFLKLTLKNN